MKRLLFQGDSITDCMRDREIDRLMGQGYAFLIGARLGYEQPGAYQVLNRGVSGDRIVDLYARGKKDCWNLAPDYLSILIGVNDVWHELNYANGVEADRFHRLYHVFLAETGERLPNCQVFLIQPFLLHGTATDELGFEHFRAEVVLRQQAVKELAGEFGLPCLDLQEDFERLAAKTTPGDWLLDGIHPTPAGHELIAQRWLELFRTTI